MWYCYIIGFVLQADETLSAYIGNVRLHGKRKLRLAVYVGIASLMSMLIGIVGQQ